MRISITSTTWRNTVSSYAKIERLADPAWQLQVSYLDPGQRRYSLRQLAAMESIFAVGGARENKVVASSEQWASKGDTGKDGLPERNVHHEVVNIAARHGMMSMRVVLRQKFVPGDCVLKIGTQMREILGSIARMAQLPVEHLRRLKSPWTSPMLRRTRTALFPSQ